MAEAFVGKWIPDRSTYAGAEEFFTALGQADTIKDFQGARDTEVTLSGNTLTFVTHIENKGPRTDLVRVGETDEITLPNGPTMQSKNRLEGDRLISDIYVGDNLAMSLTRYVKGNELISEFTASGKTFIFKSTRA